MSVPGLTLTLYLPGLFSLPESLLAGAPEHFRFLLARARRQRQAARGYGASIRQLFGLRGEAAVAATAQAIEVGGDRHASWLRVDPICLVPNREHLVAMPVDDLSMDEACALILTLNHHFAEDGLTFYAPHPQRWYVSRREPFDFDSPALADVIGRNVMENMPTGEGAGQWRQLMNEAQMLLHDHEVNQRRQTKGRAMINSLWPWGQGSIETPPALAYDKVWTDDVYVQGLAQLAQGDFQSLPLSLSQCLGQADAGSHLVVFSPYGVGPAAEAWYFDLQRFADHWLEGIPEYLRTGELREWVLLGDGPASFHLRASDLWKFWRRSKPLSHWLDNQRG